MDIAKDGPAALDEESSPVPEPQPSTSGAGRRGPPTRVGADFSEGDGSDPDPGSLTPSLYNIPIEDLNLSMRGYNCLRRSGYMMVGQILEADEAAIMGLHNFGRKSYDDLREALDAFGILAHDAKWPG